VALVTEIGVTEVSVCASGFASDFLLPVEWVVPRFQQLCRESLAETGLPKHDFIKSTEVIIDK
jgi:hypothetical protein